MRNLINKFFDKLGYYIVKKESLDLLGRTIKSALLGEELPFIEAVCPKAIIWPMNEKEERPVFNFLETLSLK